jgi:hypothetical protein
VQATTYEPHYRTNVIETLRLLASRDAQLDYQQRVPIAQVSAELFCQWADDNFDPTDHRLQALFTPTEWQTLLAFHASFESISSRVPEPLPPIQEFVSHPLWQQLADSAADALKSFPNDRNA